MSKAKQIYIMRGIQGSGKSTAAKSLMHKHTSEDVCRATIVSADDYFTNSRTGEYIFKVQEMGNAHQVCMMYFLNALDDPAYEAVIVDNTNISLHELAPYITVAQARRHPVKIIECRCSIQKAIDRQTHNVPLEIIERKFEDFQSIQLPNNWESLVHIWIYDLSKAVSVIR